MRRAWKRGRGRIAFVAAAAALVAVATVAGLVLAASDEGETAAVAVQPNSVVLVDPDGNRVVDVIQLDGKPTRLAYGDGEFWVVSTEARQVVRVDEEDGSVERFQVGAEPYDVAVGAGAAWVPDHGLRRLLRIDAQSGEVRQSEIFDGQAVSVGYGFDAAWVVVVPGVLMRVDPDTLDATEAAADVGETTEFFEPKLAFTDDALWIASPASGELTRVDPVAATVRTQADTGITGVAAAGRAVWVTNDAGFLSTRTVKAKRIRVGEAPVDVTATENALWVADYDGKAVIRVDPNERRVIARVELEFNPVAVAAGERLVAVAVEQSPFS